LLKPSLLNILVVTMARVVSSLISFALANPSILSDSASLLQVKTPTNDDGAVWKAQRGDTSARHPGDGSKKKGHFLDAAFLEYQFAEEIVDEAGDARHTVQEVLYQLRQDVDFEKENLEMKVKVVEMWGKRISQFENIYARTSDRVAKNYAALEAKRNERTVMRSEMKSTMTCGFNECIAPEMKSVKVLVNKLQNLQDVIDEMQTSFRGDRAERHTVKMNLKRCRGYEKVAVDEVAQQRTLISDMTREYTENNAPAKLAALAAKDVEDKAKRNAGNIRGRMWRTWRKWRRADTKTKKEATSAKRQARRASQKRLKAAGQDKTQAVKERTLTRSRRNFIK